MRPHGSIPLIAIALVLSAMLAAQETSDPAQTPKSSQADSSKRGIVEGTLIHQVAPVYPWEAKVNDIEGPVILSAVISKDGSVKNIHVVSGPKELSPAAVKAVKQWRYKPYFLNGEPVEVDTQITINFEIPVAYERSVSGAVMQSDKRVRLLPAEGAARILTTVAPVYPQEAREKRISGAVTLYALVDYDGSIRMLKVLSGHPLLTQAAVDAVKAWKFKPYSQNGELVQVDTNFTVNFSLSDH